MSSSGRLRSFRPFRPSFCVVLVESLSSSSSRGLRAIGGLLVGPALLADIAVDAVGCVLLGIDPLLDIQSDFEERVDDGGVVPDDELLDVLVEFRLVDVGHPVDVVSLTLCQPEVDLALADVARERNLDG
jgi:hypothetical protein